MEVGLKNILTLLENDGPLTGKDILAKTGANEFNVWYYCVSSPQIKTKIVGKRYLRLDRQVEGYARLSPSIMREFYGYTMIGTIDQAEEINRKADQLYEQIVSISKNKFQLAQDLITNLAESQNLTDQLNKNACAMIAGDVTYHMSHMEPRPEMSTGEMVQGSDLDIVIITNGLENKTTEFFDSLLYHEKYRLLRSPSYREEIDYLVKSVAKVEQQLQFDCFEAMIACKILNEGKFLYGNHDLFQNLKNRLTQKGIPQKLLQLEQKAILHRNEAEIRLFNHPDLLLTKEFTQLFYTTKEKEEFF
jgi:hypothetical protein